MHKIGESIQLSASDLVGHLNCRHLTGLDIAVANGVLEKPKIWDPLLEILRERGARHEQDYIEHLRKSGHAVTFIDGVGVDQAAVSHTINAMRAGSDIIVQGAFRAEGWGGRTDVLRRVDAPSDLGAWSYEVIDTKLARETKGGTVLQLCLYSILVASVQGLTPEFSYVVAPWSNYEPQAFRTDYFAVRTIGTLRTASIRHWRAT
jgi:predicted RecB family nuclease